MRVSVRRAQVVAVLVGGLVSTGLGVLPIPSASAAAPSLVIASADLPGVDVDPVQGDARSPEKFTSPDLPDDAADLPEGDGAAQAGSSWAEVGDVPVEVRAANSVTVLPVDPTQGATSQDIPADPGSSNSDVPVAVSVAPTAEGQTPGLVVDVQPTDGSATNTGGATDGATGGAVDGQTSQAPAFDAPGSDSPSAGPSSTNAPSGSEGLSASGATDSSNIVPGESGESGAPGEPQAVDVRLSYADFRYAFGGDWGSRLRVIAYPACFKTTPEIAACSQGVVVPSVNDEATQTLTFTTVDLARSAQDAEAGSLSGEPAGPAASSDPSSPGASAPSDAPSSPAAGGSGPAAALSRLAGAGDGGWWGAHGGRMAAMGAPAVGAAAADALAAAVLAPGAARGAAGGSVSSLVRAADPAAGTAGGTTYVVSASGAGSNGNFGAEPTKPADSWQTGQGSGDFSYSYPLTLPAPAVGGSAPSLSIDYSSGAVDGMNMAENGQASMMGLGWSLSSSYITRDFANCLDDGHTGFADLCWKTTNGELFNRYSIVLNGHATTIVRDSSDNTLRLQDDPGWTVEKVAGDGVDTSLPNNADAGDEAIKVMDPDGTTYWFGFGWGSNSVLTVPVYGDDAGEPCYDATDIHKSSCRQGWRFGLDKVVDRKGNITLFDYARVQNYYAGFNQSGTDGRTAYDRDGYLTSIRYGFNRGTGVSPSSAQAYTKVNLNVRVRCVDALTNPDEGCTGAKSAAFDPSGWPDVPTDEICTASQTTCSNFSPTFFSTARYDSISTQRVNGASIYNVDKYQFTFAMPTDPDNPNDPNNPSGQSLWLSKIQHTGLDPDSTYAGASAAVTLPSVGFNGVWLRNRVDPAPGTSTFGRLRVDSVRNETGGRIDVTYGHATGRACTSTTVDGLARYQSISGARECYPRLLPQTQKWGWWHKYVVTRVALGDDATGYRAGQAPTDAPISPGRLRVYDYEYLGAPGWRYRSSLLTDNKAETWDDWRGYEEMVTHTRRVGADQVVDSPLVDVARHDAIVFRGLDNTKLNYTDNTFRSESVTTIKGTYLDAEWRNGRLAQSVERDNDDQPLARTAYEYSSYKTADSNLTPDAFYTYQSAQSVLSRAGGDEQNTTVTVDPGGGNHHGKMLGAVRTSTDDAGTPADASDDVAACMYYLTSATTALRVPRLVETRQSGCQSSSQTSATLLNRTAYYYDGDQDGGAAPTDGDPNYTTVSTGNPTSPTITTLTKWDAYGRPITARIPTTGGPTGAVNSAPYARTYYNGSDATTSEANGFVTSVETKTPAPDTGTAGFTTTQTLSRTRGQVTSARDANGRLTTIERDNLGRPVNIWLPGRSQAAGQDPSTTYTYTDTASAAGRVTTEVLREGTTYDRTLAFYDGWGRPFQTSTRNTLSDAGQPEATTRIATLNAYDERGQVWFDSPGFPIVSSSTAVIPTTTAAIGTYATTSYDELTRPTRVNDKSNGALIRATTNSYGARSDTVSVLDPAGNPVATTKSTYNPRLQVATVNQYANGTSPSTTLDDGYAAYTYTPTGQLDTIKTPSTTSHTDALLTYDYDYDLLGRRTSATDPDTGTTRYTYDARGNTTSVDDAMPNDVTPGTAGGVITTSYDALDRPVARAQATTSAGANAGTNSAYPLAEWAYDDATVPNSLGRPTRTTSHTALGDFTSTIDSYDVRGNPLATTENYPAKLTGESASTTTGPLAGTIAKTTRHTYNELSETTSTTYPAVPGLAELTTTNSYGSNGILTGITTPMTGGSRSIATATYDALNRPLSVTSTSAGGSTDPLQMQRAYTWTPDGQLDTLAAKALNGATTYDQLKYAYTYDAQGNPTQIAGRRQDAAATPASYGAWCYAYDGISRLTSADTAKAALDTTTNNPTTSCAQPNAVEAATVKNLTGETYALDYTYAQTRLKSVTTTSAITGTSTAAGTGPATMATNFTYPAAGTGHPHAPDSATQAGTGSTQQLAIKALPDPGTLTYDAVGRATIWNPSPLVAPTSKYTYDAQGNLTAVDDPNTPAVAGPDITNAYDANGIRLVRKTPTSTVVYIAGAEITTIDGTRTSRRTFTTPGGTPLAQQNGSTAGEIWTWLFADASHTIKLAKDATNPVAPVNNSTVGTTVSTATSTYYAYYPYGDLIPLQTTLPGEHGYLNKIHDPDGTIRLDHRSYDPSQAVLFTPDPVLTPNNPQNLNAYAYSSNNPIGRKDPTGLADICVRQGTCETKANPNGGPPKPKHMDPGPSEEQYAEVRLQQFKASIVDGIDLTETPAEAMLGIEIPYNYEHHASNKYFAAAGSFLGNTLKVIEEDFTECGLGSASGAGHCALAAFDLSGFVDFGASDGLRVGAAGVQAGVRTEAEIRAGAAAVDAAKTESRLLDDVTHLPCNCLVAGTKVETVRGLEPIEDIEIGDKVWARNLATGESELRTVTGLFHKHADQVMTITVAGGAKVTVTEEHPFYVEGLGWVMSGDLRIGDHLAQRNGGSTTIQGIDVRPADTTVYSFSVAGDHNYFVTEAQLLVHNCAMPRGTPRGNIAQNKQFNDAIRSAESQLGRKLSKDERSLVHREISGQDYGYHDIVDEVLGMFGGD